jgi:hypothetical protein
MEDNIKRRAIVSFLLAVLLLPAAYCNASKVKRYTFEITIGQWNILPDVPVKSLMINHQVPGSQRAERYQTTPPKSA